jgi:hypothetical protein
VNEERETGAAALRDEDCLPLICALPDRDDSDAGFQPVGLARIVAASGRGHLRGRRERLACALARTRHVHVHRLVLDLDDFQQPLVNWPHELAMLAASPTDDSVIAAFRQRLPHDDTGVGHTDRWIENSHGLVSRHGALLPLAPTYELIRTTLKLAALMAVSSTVVSAFGHSLARPAEHQTRFLLTCLAAVNLPEEKRMIGSAAPRDRAALTSALYGDISLAAGQNALVSLAPSSR